MLINTSYKELVGLQKYSLGIYKTSFTVICVDRNLLFNFLEMKRSPWPKMSRRILPGMYETRGLRGLAHQLSDLLFLHSSLTCYHWDRHQGLVFGWEGKCFPFSYFKQICGKDNCLCLTQYVSKVLAKRRIGQWTGEELNDMEKHGIQFTRWLHYHTLNSSLRASPPPSWPC